VRGPFYLQSIQPFNSCICYFTAIKKLSDVSAPTAPVHTPTPPPPPDVDDDLELYDEVT